MKFLKVIGLFFIYPVIMLCIGFVGGILSYDFFYPGAGKEPVRRHADNYIALVDEKNSNENSTEGQQYDGKGVSETEVLSVFESNGTLNADTKYILQETDVLKQTTVETEERVPAMYLGMNREQFLTAMEQYEAYPPLAEMERGFIGLEVLSFSTERVVVQMNYQYVQPGSCFYLAVIDNEIVVLLEDKKTVYISTGMQLEELPDEVQAEIIEMRFVEDEEKLYNFLEAYSS